MSLSITLFFLYKPKYTINPRLFRVWHRTGEINFSEATNRGYLRGKQDTWSKWKMNFVKRQPIFLFIFPYISHAHPHTYTSPNKKYLLQRSIKMMLFMRYDKMLAIFVESFRCCLIPYPSYVHLFFFLYLLENLLCSASRRNSSEKTSRGKIPQIE